MQSSGEVNRQMKAESCVTSSYASIRAMLIAYIFGLVKYSLNSTDSPANTILIHCQKQLQRFCGTLPHEVSFDYQKLSNNIYLLHLTTLS